MIRSILLVLTLTLTVGCAIRGPQLAASELAPLAELRYPADAPLGADLDMVVVREGGHIDVANRTAGSYSNVQLWLNEQWVTVAQRIDIGTDNRFLLSHFVDQHQRTFPVGGFLTPDRARQVVHAELFNPETGQRHRLTVQMERGK